MHIVPPPRVPFQPTFAYQPLPPHHAAPSAQALGGGLQYEVAVGQNGRVWVCATSARTTVLVANAISASEFLTPLQVETLVGRLVAAQVQ